MGRKHVLVLPVALQAHFVGIYRFALEIARRDIRVTFVGSGKLIALVRSFDDLQGLDVDLIPYQDYGIEESVPSGNGILDFDKDLPAARGYFQCVLDKLLADKKEGIPGPTCIIADRFLAWVIDSAKQLNIPYYQFFSCGATYVRALQAELSLISDGSLVIKRDPGGYPYLEEFEGYLKLPGLPPLEYREMLKPPPFHWQGIAEPPLIDLEIGRNINEADGVIVNTFYELETPQVDSIRQVWTEVSAARIPKLFLVGPVSSAANFKDRSIEAPDNKLGPPALQWLDGRPPLSVVYVCVGSLAVLSPLEVQELAKNLEASEQSFLWVASRGMAEAIPPDFASRTREKGLVVSGWVPQLRILQHPAVGGFVTHCGWNSVIESISSGVPMACWPQMPNDQFINCRYLVDVLKIAVEVRSSTRENPSAHLGLEVAVRLLLSDEGKVLRARVQELKKKAEAALADGGSTKTALNDLVQSIPS